MRAGGCLGSLRGPHRHREQRGRGAEGAAAPRVQAGRRSPQHGAAALQTRSRDPKHRIWPGTGPWVQDVTRDRVLGNPRVPKGARHRRHRSASPRSRGADISLHLALIKLDDLAEALGQGRGKGPRFKLKRKTQGRALKGRVCPADGLCSHRGARAHRRLCAPQEAQGEAGAQDGAVHPTGVLLPPGQAGNGAGNQHSPLSRAGGQGWCLGWLRWPRGPAQHLRTREQLSAAGSRSACQAHGPAPGHPSPLSPASPRPINQGVLGRGSGTLKLPR